MPKSPKKPASKPGPKPGLFKTDLRFDEAIQKALTTPKPKENTKTR
jgi:hypothetical protein